MTKVALLVNSRINAPQSLILHRCLRHIYTNVTVNAVIEVVPATANVTAASARLVNLCKYDTREILQRNANTQICVYSNDAMKKRIRWPVIANHYIADDSLHRIGYCYTTKSAASCTNKSTTSKTTTTNTANNLFGEAANLGLFAKFKLMYKRYWYVLIPVHVITSLGWFGCFYYLSKFGVDIPSMLQYLHLSETLIKKVQGSDMGHYAIAYLCYKVATPLRYAVTLGGTTISIKYLVQAGHIKPMPSKSDLMKMYEEKKAIRDAERKSKKHEMQKSQTHQQQQQQQQRDTSDSCSQQKDK